MTGPACDLRILEQICLKVFEASPDAMVVINRAGVITSFNVQAELLFGVGRNEVLGQQIEVLIPEAKRVQHVASRVAYFNEPKTREMGLGIQLEGRYRDGTTFPVQIKLAPIVADGIGVFALAVVRRITLLLKGESCQEQIPPR